MRAPSAIHILVAASAALSMSAFAQTGPGPAEKLASDDFEVATLQEQPEIGDDVAWGSASQPIVLVEYGDFQCPFTKDAQNAVHVALASGQVRVIFKPLPLDRHGEMARATAQYYVAVSAMYPDRALAYADLLFAKQDEIHDGGPPLLRQLTQQFGVDLPALDSELKNPSTLYLLRDGIREADRLGFDGTPTFVIGKKSISGDPTPDYLVKLVKSNS